MTEKENIKEPQEKNIRYFRRGRRIFASTFSARETLAGKNYAGFFRLVLSEDGKAFVVDAIKLKKEG